MKIAIVYYSFEGNCAFAAKTLKEAFEASGGKVELFEIALADEKKRSGFSKFLWGGSMVMMKKKPAIKPLSIDFSAFDLIVLGAPVWAGNPAPPAAVFLETANLRGKKTAFFCCHAGGKGKAPEKFRALLAGSTIAGEIDMVNPAKNSEGLKEKLSAWAAALLQA